MIAARAFPAAVVIRHPIFFGSRQFLIISFPKTVIGDESLTHEEERKVIFPCTGIQQTILDNLAQ